MAGKLTSDFVRDMRAHINSLETVDVETIIAQELIRQERDAYDPELLSAGRRVLPQHSFSWLRFMTISQYRDLIEKASDIVLRNAIEYGYRHGIHYDEARSEIQYGGH